MPCMILTGHPYSGKTTVARQIQSAAERRGLTVVLINEESLHPATTKQQLYGTSLDEKKTRGSLKTAFDRSVAANPQALILLDSLNYIKGVRYELYCIAKQFQQTYSVVWILDAPRDGATNAQYTPELLQELLARYEPPDERNRWDRPLYTLGAQPQSANAHTVFESTLYNMHNVKQQQQPQSLIHGNHSSTSTTAATTTPNPPKRSAFKRKAKKPNATPATLSNSAPTKTALTADALAALDLSEKDDEKKVPEPIAPTSTTMTTTTNTAPIEQQIQLILDQFLSETPLQAGASTRLHHSTHADSLTALDHYTRDIVQDLLLVSSQQTERSYTAAELRTARRAYLEWTHAHPPSNLSRAAVTESFLRYLETQVSLS